jgi:molybdopterin synthase catalytic subunit
VYALHRAEALAAVGEFIDRMKRDVPIWKTALTDAPMAS